MISIPVFCSCGKAVPCYFYCDSCKRVHGSPNCPCGKPLKGVRTPHCPSCTPSGRSGQEDLIRARYYRTSGICESGHCEIPKCPTCSKSEFPLVYCVFCHKEECDRCATTCIKKMDAPKYDRKHDATVTYSDKGSRYPKSMRQDRDKDRPKMFVESWEYRKDRVIRHQLIGFEKKEA